MLPQSNLPRLRPHVNIRNVASLRAHAGRGFFNRVAACGRRGQFGSIETIIPHRLLLDSDFTLVGTNGWLSIHTIREMRSAVLWVDRTHDVIEVVKELNGCARGREAALRTYMLTGSAALKRDEYRKQAF